MIIIIQAKWKTEYFIIMYYYYSTLRIGDILFCTVASKHQQKSQLVVEMLFEVIFIFYHSKWLYNSCLFGDTSLKYGQFSNLHIQCFRFDYYIDNVWSRSANIVPRCLCDIRLVSSLRGENFESRSRWKINSSDSIKCVLSYYRRP